MIDETATTNFRHRIGEAVHVGLRDFAECRHRAEQLEEEASRDRNLSIAKRPMGDPLDDHRQVEHHGKGYAFQYAWEEDD